MESVETKIGVYWINLSGKSDMFSQTSEYALRAAVFLASEPSERRTARDIADAMDIPVEYLSKVLQSLARAGLVEAQRGHRGGFRLARSGEKISLLDVMNAVDPVRRISTCPLRLEQHRHVLCPLHRKLDQALAGIERDFRQTSISDLIDIPLGPALVGVSHAS
jgi:Rrf2 family protein